MEIPLAGWIAVIVVFAIAVVMLRRMRAPRAAAAGCTVECDCAGTNCSKSHIHCAFKDGDLGDPSNPDCTATCAGRCDGSMPAGHTGLHSCTHGHPF